MTYAQEDVDHFLDHHGVKGQKWGVRRKKAASVLKSGAKGAGTGLAIAGAYVAASMLTQHGLKKINVASKNQDHFARTMKLINDNQNTKMTDVHTFTSGTKSGSASRISPQGRMKPKSNEKFDEFRFTSGRDSGSAERRG